MSEHFRLKAAFLLLALLAPVFNASPALPVGAWRVKVDPWVLSTIAGGETEFIVFLNEQAELSGAAALDTKDEKAKYVFEQLRATAARTQGPLLADLAARGVEYRPYWISNMVWVRGDMDTLQAIASRPDVARVHANPEVKEEEPVVEPADFSVAAVDDAEWNLAKIRATHVWAAGFKGQGTVVGIQDTGFDWDHPALKDKYRGWNGFTADHNYNWHDAIHSASNNLCGSDSIEPCDDYGHGTHTLGIIVGADPTSGNEIGMAPEAKWIGCRNMDRGVGSPITYSECYQWFLAPTDLNDQNPDPSLAPDVINNSWSCTVEEGCTDPEILRSVVEAVKAAGIVVVHSAGNDGPDCSTINAPGAIYDAAFTVGNTTYYDTVSSSSARGPVLVDGSGRMKPDISAPGTSIRSSAPGGGYTTMSGTSMASPHVTGLVSLLISAQPALRGHVDDIEKLIEKTSVPLNTTETCGGVPGVFVPNDIYGWGRIDAWSALHGHVLVLENSASEDVVQPGDILTYTLRLTHVGVIPTKNVTLTDYLPDGTVFLDATASYSFDGSAVQWYFSSVEPEQVQEVQLSVLVSSSASGNLENGRYSAVSDDVVDPATGDPVITPVETPAFGFTLQPSTASVIWPGGVATYTHELQNTGNTQDVFDFSFMSSRGWAVLSTGKLVLQPGESATVTVTVSVPADSSRGEVETTSLTVVSLGDPTLTQTLIDDTMVGDAYYFPMMEKTAP